MKLDEIYNKKWKVPDNLIIRKIGVVNIMKEEQECHFNVIKSGYNDPTKNEILFSCSFQAWITKLSKSERVTLKKILVSTKDDYIIHIDGTLDENTITIKKAIPTINEELKKRRAINLQNLRTRNRL